MRKRLFIYLCLLLCLPMLARADAEETAPAIPEPTAFVSEHRGSFNGSSVHYVARAGETYLRDADGEPTASIFSFAYVAKDASEDRPVTFVWNGGPGSASLWLHMGTFGPKRVVVPSDASHPGVPPYPIVDATETILDLTDLVFIDPVGTGYSRALGDHEGTEFWGLTEDAASMAEFIKRWLAANGRWNSPKFILGESFGTTRAALVAKLLEDEYRVALNGLVMISQALDYAGSTPYVRDNLISYVTYVPTMAATAWHHGKVDREGTDLETFLQDARNFAVDELLPALFRGNALDPQARRRVRDGLVRFTGLSPTYVERANLRINGRRFAAELLRDQGLTVGLNDARYLGDPVDHLADRPGADAAGDAFSAAFTGALLSYLHGELGITWERPYLSPADPELSKHWNWSRKAPGDTWEPAWVNTAHDLARALEANPALRVFVAGGYHDLVTPFFDAEFTLRRHGIGAERVDFRFYHGGHMMYVHEPSRQALLGDVRSFMNGALRGAP
ncbi:S10 family peptidase [Pseudohaliea rubra]|uniref:Carboxypeptidase-related protein n=1 Tax=Pseudohaliea rubra DSM 19751 TaxID=1265313 RepID=A0A095X239_9GAMM|nr:serine carboxypeptidase [Pseudohaliea rubra]KGE04954.1 Carboxypeptidase-related protein [Pseudohaliea rubra DSM 19751]